MNPQTKDGRGNICPVTIIMPTLAMEAKEAFMNEYDDNIIDVFMDKLDEAIHDAKDELIERYEWICSQDPSSARFMIPLRSAYTPARATIISGTA